MLCMMVRRKGLGHTDNTGMMNARKADAMYPGASMDEPDLHVTQHRCNPAMTAVGVRAPYWTSRLSKACPSVGCPSPHRRELRVRPSQEQAGQQDPSPGASHEPSRGGNRTRYRQAPAPEHAVMHSSPIRPYTNTHMQLKLNHSCKLQGKARASIKYNPLHPTLSH